MRLDIVVVYDDKYANIMETKVCSRGSIFPEMKLQGIDGKALSGVDFAV